MLPLTLDGRAAGKVNCAPVSKPWLTIPAEAGEVILFASWLRHAVPPNSLQSESISISVNYSWF